MSDDHQLSALGLHKSGDSVDPWPDHWQALGGSVLLAWGTLLCTLAQTLLLGLLGLWLVFVQQTEQLGSCQKHNTDTKSPTGAGQLSNTSRTNPVTYTTWSAVKHTTRTLSPTLTTEADSCYTTPIPCHLQKMVSCPTHKTYTLSPTDGKLSNTQRIDPILYSWSTAKHTSHRHSQLQKLVSSRKQGCIWTFFLHRPARPVTQ